MKWLKEVYYAASELVFRLRGMRPWSRGYAGYKVRYIEKMLMSATFDVNRLTHGHGFRLDERSVEYPWLFSRLPQDAGRLLDAGSVLNFDFIQAQPSLKSKNVIISTLAPETKCYWSKGISYVYEDLRQSCFRDNYFDWVVCLSTLEHIGLNNTMLYTTDTSKRENSALSYLGAIQEFHRMLKPGGVLYLSFPFGRHENRDWFQIFDAGMVEEIIRTFSPRKVSEFHYKYEGDGWCVSSREASKDASYFDIHTQKTYDEDYAAASRAIACLELVK